MAKRTNLDGSGTGAMRTPAPPAPSTMPNCPLPSEGLTIVTTSPGSSIHIETCRPDVSNSVLKLPKAVGLIHIVTVKRSLVSNWLTSVLGMATCPLVKSIAPPICPAAVN